MPLSGADRAFLKEVYGHLADKPLPPDSPVSRASACFPVFAALGKPPNFFACSGCWRHAGISSCMPMRSSM
jgi:hypothetical protein